MSASSPTKPTKRASINQSSLNDAQSMTSATRPTGTSPSTVRDNVLKRSGLMLPPPYPRSSPPPVLKPIAAHTATPCSNTDETSVIISSPLSATGSNYRASPSSSPRNLKLQSQIFILQTQITAAQTTLDETLAKLQHHLPTTSQTPKASADQAAVQAEAEALVKRHIKLLHTYNEIKDVGQGLIGLIADSRGVRLKEVMEEMGVDEKD